MTLTVPEQNLLDALEKIGYKMTEVEIRQKELIEAKEFEIKQKELLELLPEEFRYFVKHQAWQDGHSAGYQEVLGIVNDLTYSLLEPIRQYTERIIKNRN